MRGFEAFLGDWGKTGNEVDFSVEVPTLVPFLHAGRGWWLDNMQECQKKTHAVAEIRPSSGAVGSCCSAVIEVVLVLKFPSICARFVPRFGGGRGETDQLSCDSCSEVARDVRYLHNVSQGTGLIKGARSVKLRTN